MFPYDSALLGAVETTPATVADVVQMLETIQGICEDGDGLKWFNGLYLEVTQAVQARVAAAGFGDPQWIAALDVRFARFYFAAVHGALTAASLPGAGAPGCWQAMFAVRDQVPIARIQFALAGMNAHINHDLPQAVVDMYQATGAEPQHGTTQYDDFTALNATLDGLINTAKQTLHLRLLGDALPPMSRLEDTLAAWDVAAAREAAWNNAELLAHLGDAPVVSGTFLDTLDGLTAVASKALLVPVP